jgi:hypothetical protein
MKEEEKNYFEATGNLYTPNIPKLEILTSVNPYDGFTPISPPLYSGSLQNGLTTNIPMVTT